MENVITKYFIIYSSIFHGDKKDLQLLQLQQLEILAGDFCN